ncbi:MAG TPA: cupredoxin domain-containing protein [Vicinamibacterales bacterium]|nr:cupredoxin domain-containing protein [Vicinamibacterales bacterium]
MKRFAPTLLLALPFVVVLTPQLADSTRTVDVRLSRYAIAPEQIEVRVGERVRLNLVSLDRAHGFRVKELGLNVPIPAGGRLTVELMPKEAGTFEIVCSEYCGAGHGRMKAWLVVKPGP